MCAFSLLFIALRSLLVQIHRVALRSPVVGAHTLNKGHDMLVRTMANQHVIVPSGQCMFISFNVIISLGDLIRSQMIRRCYEHITLDKVCDGDLLAKALRSSPLRYC
jgi:hypothetical protein